MANIIYAGGGGETDLVIYPDTSNFSQTYKTGNVSFTQDYGEGYCYVNASLTQSTGGYIIIAIKGLNLSKCKTVEATILQINSHTDNSGYFCGIVLEDTVAKSANVFADVTDALVTSGKILPSGVQKSVLDISSLGENTLSNVCFYIKVFCGAVSNNTKVIPIRIIAK